MAIQPSQEHQDIINAINGLGSEELSAQPTDEPTLFDTPTAETAGESTSPIVPPMPETAGEPAAPEKKGWFRRHTTALLAGTVAIGVLAAGTTEIVHAESDQTATHPDANHLVHHAKPVHKAHKEKPAAAASESPTPSPSATPSAETQPTTYDTWLMTEKDTPNFQDVPAQFMEALGQYATDADTADSEQILKALFGPKMDSESDLQSTLSNLREWRAALLKVSNTLEENGQVLTTSQTVDSVGPVRVAGDVYSVTFHETETASIDQPPFNNPRFDTSSDSALTAVLDHGVWRVIYYKAVQ